MLPARRQRVLECIIESYVAKAQPVASEAIARQLGKVSSATVRNDMAALEEEGYIHQPHTSAGRVPSDKGYRYFVEQLARGEALTEAERHTITHQFHQVEDDVEEWTALAASVLARLSGNAAVVTTPRWRRCTLKRLEVVPLRERTALLVVVLANGQVGHHRIALSDDVQLPDLEREARRLDERLAGHDRAVVARLTARETGLGRMVADAALETMAQIDAHAARTVYQDGLGNVMEQPEFRQSERVRQLLQVLQPGGTLLQLAMDVLQHHDLVVSIGSENRFQPLRDFALVLGRFGQVDRAVGVMGVVGPTRMRYRRAIAGVRYLAGIMDTLIDRYYD